MVLVVSACINPLDPRIQSLFPLFPRPILHSSLLFCITPLYNMSATTSDIKIASIAMGFTLGFGLLTVWEAWKQTRRNRNPLRSTYIYMLWGEILANIIIAIIGWIFLDGIIGPT